MNLAKKVFFFYLINQFLILQAPKNIFVKFPKQKAPKNIWVTAKKQADCIKTKDDNACLNYTYVSALFYERLYYFHNRWADLYSDKNEAYINIDVLNPYVKDDYFYCWECSLKNFQPTIFHKSFEFKRISSRPLFYKLLPLLKTIDNILLDEYYDQIYLNELVAKNNEDESLLLKRFFYGSKIQMFIALVDQMPVGTCSVYLTSYGIGEIFDIYINPEYEQSLLREHIVEQACYYLKKLNFNTAITWLFECDHHFNNFTFIN